MKSLLKNVLYDVLTVVAGSLLFSASINMFITPGKIILGGATGIASVIGRFINIPIGTLIIAVNLPLLLINAKVYGVRALFKTIIGIGAVSVSTDLFTFFPQSTTDPMLCAILGGLSMGAGTGLLLSRGYTTGGTDLVASIIRYKNKRLSAGRIIMICDIIIIGALTLVSNEFWGIIYSFVSTFTFSAATDLIIDGAHRAKSVFIVSSKHKLIADEISGSLGRGVTVLYGHGHYTDEKKSVLLCVVKKKEIFELKRLIQKIDKDAFVFFCDTSYVMGYGFEAE